MYPEALQAHISKITSYSKRQIFLYIAPQNVAILKVEEALRRKASQIIFVVYYILLKVEEALRRKTSQIIFVVYYRTVSGQGCVCLRMLALQTDPFWGWQSGRGSAEEQLVTALEKRVADR